MQKEHIGLIGCAIGTAVVKLTAEGREINQANILEALATISRQSRDSNVIRINREAIILLTKSRQITLN